MHLKLSVAETERFTDVDYVDRLALVAEHAGRLVAVGRYERLPGTADAEVAFVVADEFQHQGIGTILLECLAEAALKEGVTAFVAHTLSENHDMLDVFMNSGFHVTSTREYGTVNVRFPIEPDDAYRSAWLERHHAGAGGRSRATKSTTRGCSRTFRSMTLRPFLPGCQREPGISLYEEPDPTPALEQPAQHGEHRPMVG